MLGLFGETSQQSLVRCIVEAKTDVDPTSIDSLSSWTVHVASLRQLFAEQD
jgi:hypothetical protein